MARWLLAVVAVLVVVGVSATAAAAKDLQPGDLRVCGTAGHCVPIVQRPVLKSLSSFYYSPGQPPVAPAPRHGQPMLQLVFPNGYVTGIVVAGRFLSYGVNLGRFSTSVWYRLPSPTAEALRRLLSTVRPLHFSACAARLANAGPTLSTLPRCARR